MPRRGGVTGVSVEKNDLPFPSQPPPLNGNPAGRGEAVNFVGLRQRGRNVITLKHFKDRYVYQNALQTSGMPIRLEPEGEKDHQH